VESESAVAVVTGAPAVYVFDVFVDVFVDVFDGCEVFELDGFGCDVFNVFDGFEGDVFNVFDGFEVDVEGEGGSRLFLFDACWC